MFLLYLYMYAYVHKKRHSVSSEIKLEILWNQPVQNPILNTSNQIVCHSWSFSYNELRSSHTVQNIIIIHPHQVSQKIQTLWNLNS